MEDHCEDEDLDTADAINDVIDTILSYSQYEPIGLTDYDLDDVIDKSDNDFNKKISSRLTKSEIIEGMKLKFKLHTSSFSLTPIFASLLNGDFELPNWNMLAVNGNNATIIVNSEKSTSENIVFPYGDKYKEKEFLLTCLKNKIKIESVILENPVEQLLSALTTHLNDSKDKFNKRLSLDKVEDNLKELEKELKELIDSNVDYSKNEFHSFLKDNKSEKLNNLENKVLNEYRTFLSNIDSEISSVSWDCDDFLKLNTIITNVYESAKLFLAGNNKIEDFLSFIKLYESRNEDKKVKETDIDSSWIKKFTFVAELQYIMSVFESLKVEFEDSKDISKSIPNILSEVEENAILYSVTTRFSIDDPSSGVSRCFSSKSLEDVKKHSTYYIDMDSYAGIIKEANYLLNDPEEFYYHQDFTKFFKFKNIKPWQLCLLSTYLSLDKDNSENIDQLRPIANEDKRQLLMKNIMIALRGESLEYVRKHAYDVSFILNGISICVMVNFLYKGAEIARVLKEYNLNALSALIIQTTNIIKDWLVSRECLSSVVDNLRYGFEKKITSNIEKLKSLSGLEFKPIMEENKSIYLNGSIKSSSIRLEKIIQGIEKYLLGVPNLDKKRFVKIDVRYNYYSYTRSMEIIRWIGDRNHLETKTINFPNLNLILLSMSSLSDDEILDLIFKENENLLNCMSISKYKCTDGYFYSDGLRFSAKNSLEEFKCFGTKVIERSINKRK